MDDFIELTDDSDLSQTLVSYFETLQWRRKAEGLSSTELNPCFPQNFGTLVSGHVAGCQEQTTVWKACITQYKARLQIRMLAFGNGYPLNDGGEILSGKEKVQCRTR